MQYIYIPWSIHSCFFSCFSSLWSYHEFLKGALEAFTHIFQQYVSWCMSGSLTSGFLWSRWRGKLSRHSRRMRNPQLCVSGEMPMVGHQSKGCSCTQCVSPSESYVHYKLVMVRQIMTRCQQHQDDANTVLARYGMFTGFTWVCT